MCLKTMLNKITGGFSASAKVIDGTLILSLPDAVDPVVWRMDLGHVRSSAIEVRAQDDGIFMLTLKTPKGDVNDIAPYHSRAKAVSALVAVSRAMEQARGEIRPVAASGTAANDSAAAPVPRMRQADEGFTPGRMMAGIVGLLLVVGLIGMIMKMNPSPANLSPASGETSSASSDNAPAGQPMSADDFLSRQ